MSTVVEREPARFSPVRQPSCPIGMLAPRLMVLPAAEDKRAVSRRPPREPTGDHRKPIALCSPLLSSPRVLSTNDQPCQRGAVAKSSKRSVTPKVSPAWKEAAALRSLAELNNASRCRTVSACTTSPAGRSNHARTQSGSTPSSPFSRTCPRRPSTSSTRRRPLPRSCWGSTAAAVITPRASYSAAIPSINLCRSSVVSGRPT